LGKNWCNWKCFIKKLLIVVFIIFINGCSVEEIPKAIEEAPEIVVIDPEPVAVSPEEVIEEKPKEKIIPKEEKTVEELREGIKSVTGKVIDIFGDLFG